MASAFRGFVVLGVWMPVRPPVHRPAFLPPPAQSRRDQLRALDDRRGSAASRGYDAAWRKARSNHLAQHPLCKFCEERGLICAAVDVDHVVPIALRPDLRLDPTNFRSLCKPCHSSLTASGTQFRK